MTRDKGGRCEVSWDGLLTILPAVACGARRVHARLGGTIRCAVVVVVVVVVEDPTHLTLRSPTVGMPSRRLSDSRLGLSWVAPAMSMRIARLARIRRRRRENRECPGLGGRALRAVRLFDCRGRRQLGHRSVSIGSSPPSGPRNSPYSRRETSVVVEREVGMELETRGLGRRSENRIVGKGDERW